MAYSVMYDPKTGSAKVELSQEEYERIIGKSWISSLRDLLKRKK